MSPAPTPTPTPTPGFSNSLFQPLEAAELERKKKMESKKKSTLSQSSLLMSFSFSKQYDQNSKKHKDITRRLAVFVGASNVALSLVDNVEFRELLIELDPRYKVPHRKKLDSEIQCVFTELRAKLASSLQYAHLISICADIWSKPGMTASFLGVTAHYFSHQDNHRHSITLAVLHTADRVFEAVEGIISLWEIPRSKIFRAFTDNGSNMIAAFNRNQIEEVTNEDEDVSVNDVSADDCESELELVDVTLDEGESLDFNFQEDQMLAEIADFEQQEDDHTRVFNVAYKRTSCFIHTLQLVVKIFEANPSFRSSLKKAYGIVKRVNRSCKATERLIEKAGKKLVSNCPTRWDSTYLMISRLVDVKQHLTAVLDDLNWDNLTATQWKHLEAILELLQPFAHQTNITSAENSTTIAMVIHVLKETNLHLKEVRIV